MPGIDITWVGGEHAFYLRSIALLRALQGRCNAGPAVILKRLTTGEWLVDDVTETVRLGLEGGGMPKEDARKLVAQHLEGKGLTMSVLTARVVLMDALYGDDEDDPVGEAPGEAAAQPTPPTESGASRDSTPSEP